MISENKYRVLECDGLFSIEIYGYRDIGYLWWKKKVWSWEPTNMWGGVRNNFPVSQPKSGPFKSMDKALDQINKWRNPPPIIIHTVK